MTNVGPRQGTPDGSRPAASTDSTPRAAPLSRPVGGYNAQNGSPRSSGRISPERIRPRQSQQQQPNDYNNPPPRSMGQPAHFGSSADAYAMPSLPVAPVDEPRGQTHARSGTSTSMGSFDGDQSSRRTDSHPTHDGSDHLVTNRNSVMSFQTALTGQRSVDGLRDFGAGGQSEDAEPRQLQVSHDSSSERAVPGGWVSSGRSGLRDMEPVPGYPAAFAGPSRRDYSSGYSPSSSRVPSARQSPLVQQSALPPLAYPEPTTETPSQYTSRSSPLASPVQRRRPSQANLEATEPASAASRGDESVWDALERSETVKAAPSRPTPQFSDPSAASEVEKPPVSTPQKSGRVSPTVTRRPVPISTLETAQGPPLPAKDVVSPTRASATSPLLSDNVIPPPLPTSVPAPEPVMVASGSQSPIADFRKKPLADVTPAMQAAGVASLQSRPSVGIAGVGAHDASTATGPAESMDRATAGQANGVDGARPRSGSNAGLLPRAALVDAPAPVAAAEMPDLDTERAASESSFDTPSREPSPPPEGEVEARAEWERARMKQKSKKPTADQVAAAAAAASRKTTLRGQLKPLQLVSSEHPLPAERLARQSEATSPVEPSGGGRTTAGRSAGAAMSTQQLQRQQARDQRRSVGQINLAMGMMGGGEMASGANGPYPMFPSPTAGGPSGSRLYPGMLPQRSLVPPFELQQRPEGLLSGLIGPDGARRSINDPEVCLECMMRDEDMIDVNVLGPGLWERESDRDFDDALRAEAEEDVRRDGEREARAAAAAANAAGNGEEPSVTGHSSSQHAGGGSRESSSLPPSNSSTKVRVKRVGRHDPLTAERLKVHTQMNPPASSHRWRTLQTFLAVQAKYIAMEQRVRQEDWERIHPGEPLPVTPSKGSAFGGPFATSDGLPGAGRTSPVLGRKPVHKNHSVSDLLLGAGRNKDGLPIVGDNLEPEQQALKDRDVALAREARRRNVSANNVETSRFNKSMPPTPTIGLDDDRRRTMLSNGSAHVGRKPTPGASTPMRGSSSNDLKAMLPSTPDSSLIPPTAPFASHLSTPRGFGVRTASQLSLAPSGSMMDMHLGVMGSSNQAEHHRSGAMSALGLPSPINLRERSGSASSPQNYFGFPGDGELSAVDPKVANPMDLRGAAPFEPESRLDPDQSMEDSFASSTNNPKKKKSRGFKNFFNKMSSSGLVEGASNKRSGDANGLASPDLDASPDSPLAPPPGLAGLLARARRSTSSLVSGAHSGDDQADWVPSPHDLSPAQERYDMGPFQPPLPPQRGQSRDAPMQAARPLQYTGPAMRSTSSGSGQSLPVSNSRNNLRSKLPTIESSPGVGGQKVLQGSNEAEYRQQPQTRRQDPATSGRASNRSSVASRRTAASMMVPSESATTSGGQPSISEFGASNQHDFQQMGRTESRTSAATATDSKRSRSPIFSRSSKAAAPLPPSQTGSVPARRSSQVMGQSSSSRPGLTSPTGSYLSSPSEPQPRASMSLGERTRGMFPLRPTRSSQFGGNMSMDSQQPQKPGQQQQPSLRGVSGPAQFQSTMPDQTRSEMRRLDMEPPLLSNDADGLEPRLREQFGSASASKKESRKSKLLKLPWSGGGANQTLSTKQGNARTPLTPSESGGPVVASSASFQEAPPRRSFMGLRPQASAHALSRSDGYEAGYSSLPPPQAPREREPRISMSLFERPKFLGGSNGRAQDTTTRDYTFDDDVNRGEAASRPPRKSMNLFERPRAVSSSRLGVEDYTEPPRSQSSMGNYQPSASSSSNGGGLGFFKKTGRRMSSGLRLSGGD